MKILNIDSHATAKRALTLGGVNYPVRELSVQAFIDNLKMAQELESKGQLTPLDQLEHAVQMIHSAVPTLPLEAIKALSIDQLTLVLDFVRGELDEKLAQGSAEGAGAQPADSKR